MYETTLIKAGFNEKQVKIYLACLELGRAKVPDIARRAGIKRTTTYGVLDELLSLGLVNVSISGRTKLFRAQKPALLTDLLDERKKRIESVLPHLEQLFTASHIRPQLQFFEGKEGMKRIFEDTLKCRSKKMFQIVKVKEWSSLLGADFTSAYIQKRAEQGITAYAIHPKSGDIYDEPYARESGVWKRHVRYMPPSLFYTSFIMVYDDKVAMVSTKQENFGFIIESREFARTMEAYFHFIWKLGSKDPEVV